MGFEDDEVERFSLEPGDLLVCEGGEPGRAALWRGEIAACYYQKALHRVRPHQGVLSEYLLFAIWHLAFSGAFADQNAKTTIAHLPLDRLKRVRVPLVRETKQRELVAFIRAQFDDVLRAADASRTAGDAGKRLIGAVLRQMFGDAPIAVGPSPQTSRPNWNCRALRSLGVWAAEGKSLMSLEPLGR